MALNEIYANGDSLNYAVDPAVESGDFVVLGSIRGVAEIDAKLGDDENSYATLRHVGVFTGTTTDTAAISVGDPIYLAGGVTFGTALTADSDTGANELVGYAFRAKGVTTGSQTIAVRINN